MFDQKVGYSGDIVKDWGPKLWLGFILVLFGIITFAAPSLALDSLIILFAGLCLIVGIILVANALMGSMLYKNSLLVLFEGVLVFIVGLMVLLWPDITAITMLYLFGLFALVLGVFRVVEALMMPSDVKNALGRPVIWMLLVSGLFSAVIGILVMAWPWESLLAILWIAGLYAILFGVMMMAAALAGSKQ
ncbi:MAG TPA: DUF308 domain-containing protein [Methanomassiliicoccales archaeon]|nr:DUF308 domain-containing protein [Methanomassiliicoccales archaeon]